MTYMNPVWKYGLERLQTEGSAAGLDGILISDLTPEEHLRLQPTALEFTGFHLPGCAHLLG